MGNMINSKRIMIVEDEGITALRIENVLTAMGHTVTSVEVNGRDAIKHALTEKPDLILMDIGLAGDIDGIEASRQIGSHIDIPVVYITAFADEKILDQIRATEPFGYICKPFNDHELRMAIEIALFKNTMESQLKKQNELLNIIIDSLTHPFYVINVADYTIKYANSAARVSGVSEETTCYAFTHNRSEPCNDDEHPCVIEEILKTRRSICLEHIHYDNDGNPRTIEVHGYPIFDSKGNISRVIEYNIDITERKHMEKQLKSAAITDPLTGLFNRRGFFTLAEQQCKLSDRNKRALSMLYIDLDGMKNINDELGHKEGDHALIDTSHILKKSLREADIVARIGGDEFAVLLTDTSEPDIDKVIIANIHNTIVKHNETAGRRYELMLSIGISCYDPTFPCSIDDLLQKADELMYEDKKLHKLQKNVSLITEEKSDRRIYKRFMTSDECWAELDISGRVKIQDISIGGARVSTPLPLDKGTIYIITITPSKREEISLSGIVVWSSPSEYAEGNAENFSYMAGIKFTEMSETLKRSINIL